MRDASEVVRECRDWVSDTRAAKVVERDRIEAQAELRATLRALVEALPSANDMAYWEDQVAHGEALPWEQAKAAALRLLDEPAGGEGG